MPHYLDAPPVNAGLYIGASANIEYGALDKVELK